MEFRSPDPSANPYLALAVCLVAGLQGIKEKTEMPSKALKKGTTTAIPASLIDAVKALEKDSYIKEFLGSELSGSFIKLKKQEWTDYSRQVTEWEKEQYLDRY